MAQPSHNTAEPPVSAQEQTMAEHRTILTVQEAFSYGRRFSEASATGNPVQDLAPRELAGALLAALNCPDRDQGRQFLWAMVDGLLSWDPEADASITACMGALGQLRVLGGTAPRKEIKRPNRPRPPDLRRQALREAFDFDNTILLGQTGRRPATEQDPPQLNTDKAFLGGRALSKGQLPPLDFASILIAVLDCPSPDRSGELLHFFARGVVFEFPEVQATIAKRIDELARRFRGRPRNIDDELSARMDLAANFTAIADSEDKTCIAEVLEPLIARALLEDRHVRSTIGELLSELRHNFEILSPGDWFEALYELAANERASRSKGNP